MKMLVSISNVQLTGYDTLKLGFDDEEEEEEEEATEGATRPEATADLRLLRGPVIMLALSSVSKLSSTI